MDISGGMPAVIIKMLVASDVGKIQLLPALPAARPSGRIEGVACRGAIAIQSLQWDGKQVAITMSSVKSQSIVLELPCEIAQLSITSGAAKVNPAERTNQRLIAVSSGQPVAMVITLT
jgi:alpha-L-fucosidase 2